MNICKLVTRRSVIAMSLIPPNNFKLGRPASASASFHSLFRKSGNRLKKSHTEEKQTKSLFSRKMTNAVSPGDSGENKLTEILRKRFPNATDIAVEDISGGCGSMYEVHVQSREFSGLRTVAQHKLVTDALRDEVAKMHGLRVFTSAPV